MEKQQARGIKAGENGQGQQSGEGASIGEARVARNKETRKEAAGRSQSEIMSEMRSV